MVGHTLESQFKAADLVCKGLAVLVNFVQNNVYEVFDFSTALPHKQLVHGGCTWRQK